MKTRAELENEFEQTRRQLAKLVAKGCTYKRELVRLDRKYNRLFNRLYPELK